MVIPSSLTPNYQIVVNGKDVTTSIRPHMISLNITDNDKGEADSLSFQVGKKFERPKYGDEIKVYLGRGNDLNFVGLFFMQSTTITNNQILTIQATGLDFSKGIKEKRQQSYAMSLKEVANIIASRHQLTLKSDMDVGTRFEQHNESDMAFLNRLAKQYNAVFNIKNNTLYLMQQGADVPRLTIDINTCLSSEITHKNTTLYQSCKAIYHNTKTNKKHEATSGVGEPVLVIQGKWLDDEQALLDANHALKRANQGTAEGTVTIIGQVVFAGSELTIDDTVYLVSQVVHNVDSGWKTSLELKSPNQ